MTKVVKYESLGLNWPPYERLGNFPQIRATSTA